MINVTPCCQFWLGNSDFVVIYRKKQLRTKVNSLVKLVVMPLYMVVKPNGHLICH